MPAPSQAMPARPAFVEPASAADPGLVELAAPPLHPDPHGGGRRSSLRDGHANANAPAAPPSPSSSSSIRRRRSLPWREARPWQIDGARPSLAASAGAANGQTATASTGDDSVATHRAAALRALNRPPPPSPSSPSSRPPASRPAPAAISHPVLVRTYSGAAASEQQQQQQQQKKAAVMRCDARVVARKPPLPAVDAFRFEDILKAVEPEIGGALDAIAGICATSRYSLANHYEVHRPPHGPTRVPPAANEHPDVLACAPVHSAAAAAGAAASPPPDAVDLGGPRPAASRRPTPSPMALIQQQSSHGHAPAHAHASAVPAAPTLTAVPAPEVLTESPGLVLPHADADHRRHPGSGTASPARRKSSVPPPAPAPADDMFFPPPPSTTPATRSAAAHRRRSSVLSHLAAWLSWSSAAAADDMRDATAAAAAAGSRPLSYDAGRVVGEDAAGAGRRTAESRLRGLLAAEAQTPPA
ncbi:MAG: hypothetical protein M1826_002426 [Phylliscum demangeonii]|nr:MAG: hypothetical protein M1826_002426 [Phylliscum demangeonii]